MNTIEELIQKECPEGVEYLPLGEVCEILDSQRKPVAKGKRSGGHFPYYGANGIQDYVDSYIFDGTFILMGEDGSVINPDRTPILNWAIGKIWVNNHAHVLKEKDNIALLRYVFYALQCVDVFDIVRGTPPKLNQANMRAIEIPVPPLSVQHKIVEILDKFTSLEAELQAELEARKKQYEYYRNQLLDFTGREDVEWKTLPDISTNCDSKRKPIKSSQREFGQFPYYGASGIVDYVDGYIFDGDYLLISEDGANLLARSTKIAFSISGKNWVNNHAHVLKFNDDFLRKFVEYYVEHLDLTLYISAGAQPKLTKDKLNKIPIPLPKEDEIKRIVTILDKFEALINDQTASLAAEMKARHQQYEYYRDRLLTFSRKEN